MELVRLYFYVPLTCVVFSFIRKKYIAGKPHIKLNPEGILALVSNIDG